MWLGKLSASKNFTKVGFYAKSTYSASHFFRIHKLIAEKSDLVNFPQVTFFRKVVFLQVSYIRKRGAASQDIGKKNQRHRF